MDQAKQLPKSGSSPPDSFGDSRRGTGASPQVPPLPYNSYNRHLRQRFGERVHKITIDAGFTCPNRDGMIGGSGCIYCNNASFNPNQQDEPLPIPEQVKKGIARTRKRTGANKSIAYFQPFTNTHAAPEILRGRYRQALINDAVAGIAVGTRPDCLSESVLDVLQELSNDTYLSLEIGLQSANNRTLEFIRRGHSFEAFAEAVLRARKRGLEICAHLILGLPGESWETMMATAKAIAALDIQGVKLHPIHVCRGTRLAEMLLNKEFVPMDMPSYVKTVCDFLERLRPDTRIHRLTADAPSDILLAPEWLPNKQDLLRAIETEFQKRGTAQGSLR